MYAFVRMVPTTLQNSFSPTFQDKMTNSFTQNTNVSFQLLAIALETKAVEQI